MQFSILKKNAKSDGEFKSHRPAWEVTWWRKFWIHTQISTHVMKRNFLFFIFCESKNGSDFQAKMVAATVSIWVCAFWPIHTIYLRNRIVWMRWKLISHSNCIHCISKCNRVRTSVQWAYAVPIQGIWKILKAYIAHCLTVVAIFVDWRKLLVVRVGHDRNIRFAFRKLNRTKNREIYICMSVIQMCKLWWTEVNCMRSLILPSFLHLLCS